MWWWLHDHDPCVYQWCRLPHSSAATSPVSLRVQCSAAPGAAYDRECPSEMTQQFLRQQLAVQVLDGFGQWMTGPLGKVACYLDFAQDVGIAITIKGGVASVQNGTAIFTAATLTGVRLQYYRYELGWAGSRGRQHGAAHVLVGAAVCTKR